MSRKSLSARPISARHRRGRRAVAGLAVAGTTLGGLAIVGPAHGVAPTPKVKTSIALGALVVDGSRADEVIALRVPAAKPHLLQIDLGDDGTADASILRSRFETIVVQGRGGNDTLKVDEVNGIPLGEATPLSLRGNGGDDILLGGSGNEDFVGGPGNDSVDGNRGNDVANQGAGDDTFTWDPGDGSDSIEGRAGADTMVFNGAGVNESFKAEAFGDRLSFTRNVGNIVMDTDGVETVDLRALGGSDFTEVEDLRKTDVTAVNVSYVSEIGGTTPDGIIDTTIVSGTNRADLVTLTGSAGATQVSGLQPTTSISGADTFDGLTVYTGRGADRIDVSAVAADTARLTFLTDVGNDTVLGGAGPDDVLAGEGNDRIDLNRGDDEAHMDEDDDEFIWDPGDGSDLVYGDDGYDLMTFNGSAAAEVFDALPNDDGLLFYRDVGDIAMNTEGLEQLDVNALGGADSLTVDDLSATTTSAVTADLAPTLGAAGGDGQVDAITVKGTPEGDFIEVSGGANGAVHVEHFGQTVDISNAEPTDSLTIDGNGGEDDIDSTGLLPGSIIFDVL